MSMPSQPPRPKRVWDDPRIVVPADSVWMAMSPAERDAAFERIRAVFEEYGHSWTSDPGVDLLLVGHRLYFVERAQGDGEDADASTQRIEEERLAALDRLARTQVTLARTVLALLEARGVSLSPEQHARVAAEHEADALERWAERAPTAATAAELFADDAPPAT